MKYISAENSSTRQFKKFVFYIHASLSGVTNSIFLQDFRDIRTAQSSLLAQRDFRSEEGDRVNSGRRAVGALDSQFVIHVTRSPKWLPRCM